MTLNEFITAINDLGMTGDMELRVAAFGGFRLAKEVSSVTAGFDFDHNCAVIRTVIPLTVSPTKSKKQLQDAKRHNYTSLADRVPVPKPLAKSKTSKSPREIKPTTPPRPKKPILQQPPQPPSSP